MIELLRCPICSLPLKKVASSLKCDQNHSYDFAKSGYINLLNPGKKNNAKAGDSKEMINARTSFFSSGAYAPIRDFLCDTVSSLSPSVIVDAGCGEGYYSEKLASIDTSVKIFGFDMSKFGVEHAAKLAKANGYQNSFFSVSNIFALPLCDECADVVVSMFAPVAHEEFSRVLKKGAYLIVGAAGVSHLKGFKAAIYDNVYLNDENDLAYEGFELISRKKCEYVAEICGNENINNLFKMTPYYHRTTLHDKEKLTHLQKVTTEIEVDFFIFKKI
ncbi:MAG: methyltransferase domain-containing protein [Clostridia bacterium]|nr:methyltransferase domain-containing protein [Clostridia bacterium]